MFTRNIAVFSPESGCAFSVARSCYRMTVESSVDSFARLALVDEAVEGAAATSMLTIGAVESCGAGLLTLNALETGGAEATTVLMGKRKKNLRHDHSVKYLHVFNVG